MPHDTGTNDQPVVELDVLTTNSAIICPHDAFTSQLFEELSQLSLNPIVVLPKNNMSSDLPFVLLSELENEEKLPFDYLFVAFPSFGFTQDQFSFVLKLAHKSNIKVVVIDSSQTTKAFQHSKLLQKYSDLDYRLCLLKDYYSSYPDPKILSPLEFFISEALTKKIIIKYPQKKFYPTSFSQIIQGALKSVFKFSSYHKTYYLSVIDPVSQIELVNHLKDHISDLEVDQISTDKPFDDPSQKLAVSTQAELDWYPDNELLSYLPEVIQNSSPLSSKQGSETQQKQINDDFTHKQVSAEATPPISLQSEKPKLVISRLGDSLINELTPIKIYQPLNNPQSQSLPQISEIKETSKAQQGSHEKIKKQKVTTVVEASSVRRRFFGISRRGVISFAFISLIVLVVISPLVGSIFLGIAAVNSLKSSIDQTIQGQYQKSSIELARSEKLFNASRTLLTLFVPTKVVFSEKIDKYDRLLDSAAKFIPVAKKSNSIKESSQKLYTYTVGQSDALIDFETIRLNIKDESEDLYNYLVNLDYSLQKQNFDSSFADFQKLADFKNSIPKLRSDLKKNLEFLNTISLLLNTPGTKNYLILAQNNSELRPTGGFIELAGTITVKGGQIVDYAYSDVYSLDQKLQGLVVPPAAIKKYLGEPNWFLRDSNWQPDFAQSAKQAIWFYEKETDRKVDGVIAIDTEFIKTLLEVLGPIELKDWGLVINHTNLYEKLLYQPKKDPEPGKEARYLLVDLMTNLTEQLLTKKDLHANTSSITNLLNEVHLQLYLKDLDQQKEISQSPFAGSIVDRPCFAKFVQSGCVSETFSLNEANVGINKANYFIKRTLDHEVVLTSSGMITHKITINYENTSPSTTWPGGDYKVYMRFSAPLGSQLQSISQDNLPIGLEDTKASSTLGLAEYTFPFTVKSGKNSQLVIYLRSPRILNPQNPQSALSISWEKQPGTSLDPLRLTVSFPDSLKVIEINQKANVSPGRSQFLDQFTQDQTYALLFSATTK